MTTRLGFAGDVVLGGLVDERQRTRPIDAVWGELLPELQDIDAVCVNLSVPSLRAGDGAWAMDLPLSLDYCGRRSVPRW